MSLLLDALQRASKEKEKAAGVAAGASAAPATPAGTTAPAAKTSPLELAIEPLSAVKPPAVATASAAAPPPLTLTLEPVTSPLPTPAPAPQTAVAPRVEPPSVPPPTAAAPEARETRIEPRIAPTIAQQPDQHTPAPTPTRATAPTSPPPLAAAPAIEPKPAPQPTPATKPAAPPASSTARDILNASAKAAQPKSSKRPIVLGVAGVLVGLVTGSFFLGVWDNALDQPGPLAKTPPIQTTPPAPATEAAAPATQPPPTEQATVVSDADNQQGAEKRTDNLAHAHAPRAAASSAATTAQFAKVAPVAQAKHSAPASVGKPHHPAPATAQNRNPVTITQAVGPTSLEAGYAALTQGRLDDAAAAYRRALMGNAEERDALLGLAHIAHRHGHPAEARDLYRRVLRQDPENAVANAGLLALLSEDEQQNAGGLARELSERNPGSAAAFATLGSIMAREGRLADAQQAFFKAANLEPENSLHAYNLAVALDRLHKPDLATRYYERAIALADKSGAPNAIPRAIALQRLAQLNAARPREERPAAP